ncbi:DNA polymerase zeta [Tulasnella sp. 418]|nr:DNA polymerase zeta [Tulasnella sp. 418]
MAAPILKVRITNIDHAMEPKGSLDGDTTLRKVPIIRIYGLSSNGYKACVHIHQVYPYFYVEYQGSMEPQTVNQYVTRFQQSIDHALALSLRRKAGDKRNKYIRKVHLVKAVDFYGFHASYKPYLKVYLADPQLRQRTVTILQSGGVLGQKFRVYESHLSYILQFLCDFGLYGCGELEIGSEIFVRERSATEMEMEEGLPDIDTSEYKLSPNQRQSRLPLEIDIASHQILNRHLVLPRNIHHKLNITSEDSQVSSSSVQSEQLVQSVRELWDGERKRRLGLGLDPTPVMPSPGGARETGPVWRAEPRLRVQLEERIRRENKELSQENSVDGVTEWEKTWEKFVMTAFESKEVLWPPEYRTWRPDGAQTEDKISLSPSRRGASTVSLSPFGTSDDYMSMEQTGDGDVDEELLSSQQLRDLMNQADGVDFGGPDGDFEDGAMGPDEFIDDDVGRNGNGEISKSPVKNFISSQKQRDPRRSAPGSPIGSQGRHSRRSSPAGSITPTRSRTPVKEPEEKSAKKRHNPFSRQNWGIQEETPLKKREMYKSPALAKRYSLTSRSRNQATLAESISNSKSKATIDPAGPQEDDLAKHDVDDPAWTVMDERHVVMIEYGSPNDGDKTPRGNTNRPTTSGSEFSFSEKEGTASADEDVFLANVPGPSEPRRKSVLEGTIHRAGSFTDNSSQDDPERPSKRRRLQPIDPEQEDKSGERSRLERLASWTFGSLVPSKQSLSNPDPSSSSEDFRSRSLNSYTYSIPPPSKVDILSSLQDFGIKHVLYRDPYYSHLKDVPRLPREYAGKLFTLRGGTGIGSLEDWKTLDEVWNEIENGNADGSPRKADRYRRDQNKFERQPLNAWGVSGWEYTFPETRTWPNAGPPSRKEIEQWLETQRRDSGKPREYAKKETHSQISGPTQKNQFGFKVTQHKPAEMNRERQNMSVLGIEVFALSRGELLPDPEHDAIEAIFYCFQEEDVIPSLTAGRRSCYDVGCIAVRSKYLDMRKIRDSRVHLVDTELDLINVFVDQVRSNWDPDVLTGWELQNSSWGYLCERAERVYGLSIEEQIVRILTYNTGPGNRGYDSTHTSTFKVSGRHVLNTWRIMRVDLSLNRYTMENVVFHVLHRRIPLYSVGTLTSWFKSTVARNVASVIEYFIDRTAMVLELLDEMSIITKNAEFARVVGIDFFSVISRGSQFKVESFMFRIAKPENFMLISPSREDVGRQNAAECVPLIMEPKSAYYKSPVVVLDFQSLYPSVMIAYNYCYSTCLGTVDGGPEGMGRKLGIMPRYEIKKGLLGELNESGGVTIAPNGIMYTKKHVREGLLGRMLTELLETRVMVKQAMKSAKGDKALLRVFDARQLSLKLICNVTYGYTSASFSGRMPAVEIADSIVQSGRETLEKAITTINSHPNWGAKVVYGDTDSLFVSLEGRTKDDAFRIGNEMANEITRMNPEPVKLKFEKVYFPCLLMAKKRYVGFKYESPDDKEPVFDAKGIETVRRDGIEAGQKMVERCIKILFRSQDLSEVKAYCKDNWTRLMNGRVSIYDFIFAKEVRLGTYSDKVAPPPGVVVAARRLARDPRAIAQYGDRIPYVITRGEPKSRLIDRAFGPDELLKDRHQYQLDAPFYIEHHLIPPLERIFNLVGANVAGWYAEMPKNARADAPDSLFTHSKQDHKTKFTIDEHFNRRSCVVCGARTDKGMDFFTPALSGPLTTPS